MSPPMSNPNLNPTTQTLIREITGLRALVANAPQALGEKVTRLRDTCLTDGRLFKDAIAQAGLPEREAYRLMDTYAATSAFERLFGVRPSAPSVIRPLRRYLTDDAMLRRIAAALKARNIAIDAATADDFARAVAEARRAPQPKARKAKARR